MRRPVPDGSQAGPDLRLITEAKLARLVGEAADRRLEASGVLAAGEQFYVIFDNAPDVGRVDARLVPGDGNELVSPGRRDDDWGFEDIAYDPVGRRYFLLVEAAPRGDAFMAMVQEYGGDLAYRRSEWLDFPLASRNKGLEGLTFVRRDGRAYLLGLCEGNHCRPGQAGRRAGGGRIQVFTERAGRDDHGRGERWVHADTIRLPETLWFEDFSSLAVAGDRLAVLSQESSALWVGALRPSSWELDGDGRVHRFPPGPDGKTTYCNVEGVSWIGPDRVVVVSDKAKSGMQAKRCQAKDQSIHVFEIP